MTTPVISASITGFTAKIVDIECDITQGLPVVTVVGLAAKSVDEAKERVRSAIRNSGLNMPRGRVTLNLAPAGLPKEGTGFDLGLAVAILQSSEQVVAAAAKGSLFVGELSLKGDTRPVVGILNYLEAAKKTGIKTVFLPAGNTAQASLVDGVDVFPVANLRQLYRHLTGIEPLQPLSPAMPQLSSAAGSSFGQIVGQAEGKRALIVAAAGHHNLMMSGPPGGGKTMLARSLTDLLPPLSPAEMLEVTKLHSLVGVPDDTVTTNRPFRSPHHSASHIALVGGGAKPKPGEISLAHRGVLFLDELPEFGRLSLEALRQPLEERSITIARTGQTITYPADFMLLASYNPCPCGYYGTQERICTCNPISIQNYLKKLSGPLIDRVDLFLHVPPVDVSDLLKREPVPINKEIDSVLAARAIQQRRYSNLAKTNAHMTRQEIRTHSPLKSEVQERLDSAAKRLQLSARSYLRVVRVARTIADLEHQPQIKSEHIQEALQYRPRLPDAL